MRHRRCTCNTWVLHGEDMHGRVIDIELQPDPTGTVLVTESGLPWVVGPNDIFPEGVLRYVLHEHESV